LEKIKTCRRSRKNLSAVFDKVCVPFFRQSLARVFSAATKEIGEKLVSKFHDKVEQEIQQRDYKILIGNFRKLFLCGSKMRLAITFRSYP